MADTIDAAIVTREYQSITDLTLGAIAAGSGCTIQNLGLYDMEVVLAAEKPSESFMGSEYRPTPWLTYSMFPLANPRHGCGASQAKGFSEPASRSCDMTHMYFRAQGVTESAVESMLEKNALSEQDVINLIKEHAASVAWSKHAPQNYSIGAGPNQRKPDVRYTNDTGSAIRVYAKSVRDGSAAAMQIVIRRNGENEVVYSSGDADGANSQATPVVDVQPGDEYMVRGRATRFWIEWRRDD